MRKNLKLFLILASIISVVLLSGCTKDGYIADKIHVLGVDVGEATYAEAVEIVENITFTNGDVVKVKADDVEFSLLATEIGAEIDAQKTVDLLAEKSSGFFSGWFKKDYPAVVVVDSVLFDRVVTEKLQGRECSVVQFSYTLAEDGIKAVNGKSGYKLDRAALATKVCEILGTADREEIVMQFTVTAPDKVNANEFLASFPEEYQEAGYERDGSGNVVVTEDVPGVKMDRAAALSIMEAHSAEGEEYLIPCEIQLSEYTGEYLKECLFRDIMSTYSTSFKTSSANRSENVELAARSIDGVVLLPGEEFSFNGVVGERTAARGYKVAAAYSAGKTVDSIGGGICQVSSTLYNSVLLANLEIVTRRSHQMTVSYVPKGRDATVSWGTQDFVFKNNTDFPVKLATAIKNKNVEITVIGTVTDPTQKVEILTTTVSELEPAIETVEDPTKEVGYVDTQNGSKGYVVDAVRVVYSNGAEVSREKLTRSRYNPTKTVQTIGTMPVATEVFFENPAEEVAVQEAATTPIVSETGL